MDSGVASTFEFFFCQTEVSREGKAAEHLSGRT
jgi:hypothetical protein